MFMETSALDSTNVELAFIEVLTGCPAAPPTPVFLSIHLLIFKFFALFILSSITDSHPEKGGEQRSDARLHQRRHPVQPHHAHRDGREEPQLLQEFLTATASQRHSSARLGLSLGRR